MIPPRRILARTAPGEGAGLPANLPPALRRVLAARGIQGPEALSLDLQQLLTPDRLGQVDTAAGMVADAVTDGQRILVVGDFDADGATGTALAMLSLRALGASRVDFRVPNRFEFGYGLTLPLVETLAGDPPDLLITVDSGISCVAGVARARELGVRVIVTDHHLPGEVLPAADAIVNPNNGGDAFPSKAMAGVGVVFYLLGVVRRVLRERGWFGPARPDPNLAQFLDLVALGTVADLVPLDHNNRILVRQGLERIRRGLTRPGILALLRLGKRDYRYASAADLGFAVGPRLNAAGRLEDMAAGIRCLLSDDGDEAWALASELDELNRQRKGMQAQMQQDAMVQVRRVLDGLPGDQLPPALCLHDESWHQGIVGLVASRVKDAVHRPVIAFAPEDSASDVLKGSARSVRGLHIRDVLACVDARHPGMIAAFGGHAMAAGLTLPGDRLLAFRDALPEAVEVVLGDGQLDSEILTDGELDPREIGLELASAIESCGPWGQKFPEPLFDGWFEVLDRRVVGTSHLKMIVRSAGGGQEIDAIAFN
ncbi:MAG: single-stranded-DNA-specific exonuclease RecJ, partial [Gammaproteobacteria bacterium]|nr:single-stranded-DNA-specific exonuclease RecJ [Gammaproteobacteria bacterium]